MMVRGPLHTPRLHLIFFSPPLPHKVHSELLESYIRGAVQEDINAPRRTNQPLPTGRGDLSEGTPRLHT